MLLPRILTAVIGIPLVVYLVNLGGIPYSIFILAIIALALYEYATLLRMGSRPVQVPVLMIFGLLLPAAMSLGDFGVYREGGDNYAGLFLVLPALAAFTAEFFYKQKYLERIAFTLMGIYGLAWPLWHMSALRELRPDGKGLTFLMLVTVWFMDTAAYAAGRAFGSRQLSSISPKKTWEGAIAGFAGAFIAVFAIRVFMKDTMSAPLAAWLAAAIGVGGQLSDLAESMIKRAVGAKDSSSLLPGHGGILDRFDSYIFVAPLIYYIVVIAR